MPTFIVTGSYTSQGMKGMLEHPTDREAETRKLIEALGGKIVCYYLTTGDTDFMMVVKAKISTDIVPGAIVAGASGRVTGLKTVRAYSSAEFLEMQKRAAEVVKSFRPAG